MSLAGKFQEYFGKTDGLNIPLHIQHAVEQAFYAGAKSGIQEAYATTPEEILDEIDHFRSHK